MSALPEGCQGAKVIASRWTNLVAACLKKGQPYRVTARGRWLDDDIPADASGYACEGLKWAESMRRAPQARWFELVCQFGDDPPFLPARHPTFVPRERGTLTCFANDVLFMYWNNKGCIEVTVCAM